MLIYEFIQTIALDLFIGPLGFLVAGGGGGPVPTIAKAFSNPVGAAVDILSPKAQEAPPAPSTQAIVQEQKASDQMAREDASKERRRLATRRQREGRTVLTNRRRETKTGGTALTGLSG